MVSRINPLWVILFPLLFLISCDAESITQPGDDNDNEDDSAAVVIGGSSIDTGDTIISTSDGGFLIVGTSTSNDGDFNGMNNGNRDMFALKLSSSRNIQWLKTYGGNNSEWAQDVIQDRDGNFVITGYSRSNNAPFTNMNQGENDIFLVKISPSGELIWVRNYGGSDEDYGFAITESPLGGYVLTGSTRSVDGNFTGRSNHSKDVFIMLTSPDGLPSWVETYGGSENDEGLDVTIGNNETIAVTGSYESTNGDFSGSVLGGTSFFVIETRLNGNPIGLTRYGGNGSDFGNKIINTQDGGFAVAGGSNSNNVHFSNLNRGDVDAFIMKINSNRDIQWVNTFGGNNFDTAYDLIQTDNGDYMITGETGSDNGNFNEINLGGIDAFLIRVNADGTFNSANTYGGANADVGQSLCQIPNGNVALSGWTSSNDGDFEGPPITAQDIFFLLTDPSGRIIE